ncbi:hypothetical protein [Chachezhania sediminis]|uniref:hypothetical protein n=1 Tax=Chachezhania sediminis TaxID=2599291 RepID=UPI00131DDB82|nr:hypothetical protein [Chachezhania sediminis]
MAQLYENAGAPRDGAAVWMESFQNNGNDSIRIEYTYDLVEFIAEEFFSSSDARYEMARQAFELLCLG